MKILKKGIETNKKNYTRFLILTENGIIIPFEDPGTWNGGTIDQVVLQGGDTGANFVLPAIWYKVKYEAPSE